VNLVPFREGFSEIRLQRLVGVRVKCPIFFCPILTKFVFCRPNFRKEYLTTKCHKILSSERRVVPYEQTEVTKLTVAFKNSVKVPKTFSGHFLPRLLVERRKFFLVMFGS